MVASWRSLTERSRKKGSLVILIQKIRFTKSFTHIRTATRRLASSSTSYMDLKKEEKHSQTSAPMPINAELMLEVETGMKKGYTYGFATIESACIEIETQGAAGALALLSDNI
ncbi:hypothetical protein M9H77_36393 [Catharanthus roseus]|uniref:Uncharacterized protein n=1 Tax=Catharanthus roseus TaxID=4058 RepID=A0ACB9ZS26_CATRO|nr:hypothetical protein M9H77_36393 [Catharanthus roseus]